MTDNMKGILWALLATALYAAIAAIGKVVVREYHVLEVLMFRQIVVFLSTVPDLATDFPRNFKTRRPLLHSIRLMGAFIALTTGIWSVAVLPLATAVTLGFAQVFFVTILATWILGEQVDRHRAIAILTGFLGALIILRPGVDGFLNIYALIPIFGGVGAAIAIISVRRLSQTESTATLLVYQSTVIGLMAGIPLIWFWKLPTLPDAALMLGLGVLAAVAQWAGVQGLRMAEASVVGCVEYTKLLFAELVGFFIFQEVPDQYAIWGGTVIILASAYLLYRSALARADPIRQTDHQLAPQTGKIGS